MNNKKDSNLEEWLWKSACTIRGEDEASKYKDYILPLVFFKRLCDVFDDELDRLAKKFKGRKKSYELIKVDNKTVRFFLPFCPNNIEKDNFWSVFRNLKKNVGEKITSIIRLTAKHNDELIGVIDKIDFNSTTSGQREISDDALINLIESLSTKRLGLYDVEPDIIGRSYEYLISKFAEKSGQTAGEFYSPREVGVLMSKIVDLKEGQEIYDPNCGSAGLLIKCYLELQETVNKKKFLPLKLYGQENIPSTWRMSKMNIFIHNMDCKVALGDTMGSPNFIEKNGLKKFDVVVANPMWNQDIDMSYYENDRFDRFKYGFPTASNADLGWVQHMIASTKDKGQVAVILDTGVATRGSSGEDKSAELRIRKKILKEDLIKSVILLPENLFYNTANAGLIILLEKNKKHKNEIMMIDLGKYYSRNRPKNVLDTKCYSKVQNALKSWKTEENFCRVVNKKEIFAEENNGNILPTRYIKKTYGIKINELNAKQYEKQMNIFMREMVRKFYNNKILLSKSKNVKISEIDTLEVPNNWEVKKIKDISKFSDLTYSDIKNKDECENLSLTKDDGLISQESRFNQRLAIIDTSKYKILERGWVAFNPMVIWEGAIHALYDYKIGYVSPAYKIVKFDKWLDYRLVDFILKLPRTLNEYNRLAAGGVNRRRIVSEADFANISLAVPKKDEMKRLIIELNNSIKKFKQMI
jgi:type I restriction enzyme M protein